MISLKTMAQAGVLLLWGFFSLVGDLPFYKIVNRSFLAVGIHINQLFKETLNLLKISSSKIYIYLKNLSICLERSLILAEFPLLGFYWTCFCHCSSVLTLLASATEMLYHYGYTELSTLDTVLQRAGHSAKPEANTGLVLNMECFHDHWGDSQAHTHRYIIQGTRTGVFRSLIDPTSRLPPTCPLRFKIVHSMFNTLQLFPPHIFSFCTVSLYTWKTES